MMTTTLPEVPLAPSVLATAAEAQAVEAAERAGVAFLPLDTLAGVQAAAALFATVWRTNAATPPLAAEVMRAVEHAGGYVVGAYTGTRLIGASSGFLGLDAVGPVLHSHISGVTEPGRGIGVALKLHQRAWALRRGIVTITWTFDPLVRRNAWFNLAKLGATGVEYLIDFYGAMTDGVNAGESTDRLFTRWDLTAPPLPPSRLAGGQLVLDERDGGPLPVGGPRNGDDLLVQLPADIEQLRATSPDTARAWRLAVREALVPAFADGLTARGITRDGRLRLAR